MSVTATDQSKEDGITPAESAESFPKSHQILYRDFSNASTVLTDTDIISQRSSALKELDGYESASPLQGSSPTKIAVNCKAEESFSDQIAVGNKPPSDPSLQTKAQKGSQENGTRKAVSNDQSTEARKMVVSSSHQPTPIFSGIFLCQARCRSCASCTLSRLTEAG